MQVISYNVNGIRAAMKHGLADWLKAAAPDVFCLQEVKASGDQIEPFFFEELGYHHYWFPAGRKGYSGVAILSKEKPKHVEYGIGLEKFDCEGRVIRADFNKISVVSTYVPSGASGLKRHQYKMAFLEVFKDYILKLSAQNKNLIVSGDLNICHTPKDIFDPVRSMGASGFLPEERQWLTDLLEAGFLDSFRVFNPNPHHYSWWSYLGGARERNLGWRIDYNLVSTNLEQKLKRATILSHAQHSDHCPVMVELDL